MQYTDARTSPISPTYNECMLLLLPGTMQGMSAALHLASLSACVYFGHVQAASMLPIMIACAAAATHQALDDTAGRIRKQQCQQC